MRVVYDTILAFVAVAAATLLIAMGNDAFGQTASCTSLTVGQTQDITAFSVCKRVTLDSVPAPAAGVAGICVPTNTTAAEWQSFYDNPPPGVTIASCGVSCTGYSYGGYCYYWTGDGVTQSCDTTCASHGGCDAAGTRYIGSDDPSSARCSAVATALAGSAITAGGSSSGLEGCMMNTLKGGWIGNNWYQASTTCAAASYSGRICGCVGGGGGTAPCSLPWGGTTPHGTNVTAYAAAGGTPTCSSETRTCSNGTLSGSYAAQTCTAGCALPWGGYIASGASVTAYQAASAPTCTSETRTCTAGALSGTYQYQTCTPGGPYSYGGYLYRLGAAGATCTTACASYGGCNTSGVLAIGSGGTNAACEAVLIGLNAGTGSVSQAPAPVFGCTVTTSNTRLRSTTATTTCAASNSGYKRACACVN